MKIFILEDDTFRIDFFQKKFSKEGRTLHIANTVAQAIEICTKEGPFDILFLDHDLAPEHYPNFDGDHLKERTPDGYDFVKWMIENSEKVVKDYTEVYIHSLNVSGSCNMERAINASPMNVVPVRIPFHQLVKATI